MPAVMVRMAVALDFLQAAETEEQAAGPASTLDTMWLEMVEAEAMAAAVAEHQPDIMAL